MTETVRRYMGNSVPRKEDPALLTGHTNFTDDIRLPGMLHFALLRSPHAHARITSMDASAAREGPASSRSLPARTWPKSGPVAQDPDGLAASNGGHQDPGPLAPGPRARSTTRATGPWPWSWRPTATGPRTPWSS